MTKEEFVERHSGHMSERERFYMAFDLDELITDCKEEVDSYEDEYLALQGELEELLEELKGLRNES